MTELPNAEQDYFGHCHVLTSSHCPAPMKIFT